MAIGRLRDRSGLVTRRRVIAYLEREKRQKEDDRFSNTDYYLADDDGVFLVDDDGYYIIDGSDQPSASLI